MNTSQSFECLQASRFEEVFDVTLEKIKQGVGVTGDYTITMANNLDNDNYKKIKTYNDIEFKHDKASSKTHNLYLEFEQTLDGFFSSKPSGCDLAIKKGNLLVITSGNDCLVFDEPCYEKLLHYVQRDVPTKSFKNNNPSGSYTRGHLVPVLCAKLCCLFSYEMICKGNGFVPCN